MKIAIDTNHNVIPIPEAGILLGNADNGGYTVHPAAAGPDSTNRESTIITEERKNNQ